MSDKIGQPELFSAIDWLRHEYTLRRVKNPRYSLRSFSKLLGIPSGRLSEFMSGKRRLTARMGIRISEHLGYAPEKHDEFMSRIQTVNQPEVRTAEADSSTHERRKEIDSFHLISEWYHLAILSLMKIQDFESDYKWISQRLGISTVEVREALERMVRLGLVEVDKGQWTRCPENLSYLPNNASSAVRRFHGQHLEKAGVALEEVPKECRDFSSITMAINPDKLEVANKKIRDFRRQLSDELESEDATEVYTLGIQLYPLSKN